jgi:hypothetical protein
MVSAPELQGRTMIIVKNTSVLFIRSSCCHVKSSEIYRNLDASTNYKLSGISPQKLPSITMALISGFTPLICISIQNPNSKIQNQKAA